MLEPKELSTEDPSAVYALLAAQLRALFDGERDMIANAANLSSLVYHSLPDLNWVGFYFLREKELVLGPFHGRPACVRIPFGRGVCGTAVERRTTLVVRNVHEFRGHIACDAASNSEIVVPLLLEDRVVGVLDLDSPLVGRFGDDDRAGLEDLAKIFMEASDIL